MMDFPGVAWWGWGWMWLMMVVWGILPVLLIIYLIRLMSGRSGRTGGEQGDDALEILRKRYARGELTMEQYQEMKRDLG